MPQQYFFKKKLFQLPSALKSTGLCNPDVCVGYEVQAEVANCLTLEPRFFCNSLLVFSLLFVAKRCTSLCANTSFSKINI